jgi:hypothetical protein
MLSSTHMSSDGEKCADRCELIDSTNSLTSRHRCAAEHSSSPRSSCPLKVGEDQTSSNRFRGIPVFVPNAGAWRRRTSASISHRSALCPNSRRVLRMRTPKYFSGSPVVNCGCLMVSSLSLMTSTTCASWSGKCCHEVDAWPPGRDGRPSVPALNDRDPGSGLQRPQSARYVPAHGLQHVLLFPQHFVRRRRGRFDDIMGRIGRYR